MTTILGLDISSVRLDACLLVPGELPVLRHEILGKSSEPLIERVRRVPAAVTSLRTDAFGPIYPNWLVIEDSYGAFRNAVRALDKITGAIIASAPSETQIMLLSTHDWRTAIGCGKNTKAAGHVAVERTMNVDLGIRWENAEFDEHQLDALGIALGAQRILFENARIPGKKECRSDAQTSSGVTAPNEARHV